MTDETTTTPTAKAPTKGKAAAPTQPQPTPQPSLRLPQTPPLEAAESALASPPSDPPSAPARPPLKVTVAGRVDLRAFQGTLYPGKRINTDVYDVRDYDAIVRRSAALGLVPDVG